MPATYRVWSEHDIGELVFVNVGGGRVYATLAEFIGFLDDRLECLEHVSVILDRVEVERYGFRGWVETASDLAVRAGFRSRRWLIEFLEDLAGSIVDRVNNGNGLLYVCRYPKRIVKIYEGKLVEPASSPSLHVVDRGDVVAVYEADGNGLDIARVYFEIPWEPDYESINIWLDYYAMYWRSIERLIKSLGAGGYGEPGRHALGVLSAIELMLKTTYGTYENWLDEIQRQGVKKIEDTNP